MVVLPILFNTEETRSLEDAGLDVDVNDLEANDIWFFDIKGLHASTSYPGHSTVMANGDTYLCPLSIEQILDKINKSQVANLNLVWKS